MLLLKAAGKDRLIYTYSTDRMAKENSKNCVTTNWPYDDWLINFIWKKKNQSKNYAQ